MTSPGEESEANTGRGYATDDWPRGFGQASWWPFVTAIGIIILYIGIAAAIIGHRDPGPLASPTPGIGVSIAGILVVVSGAAGWTFHAFVARYREKTADTNREKYLWGTLLYFPVELALFGAGLLYFAFLYFTAWPPEELPELFPPVVIFMTVALFTSAFTLYFSGRELRKGNHRRFLTLLVATPILGIIFVAGKLTNYHRLIVREGYTIESGSYWTAFFAVDGLHGLLVAIGVVLLLILLVRVRAGHITPDRHLSLTTVAMYWWMLEGVWLLIVVEIYGVAALCRATGPC